MDEKEVQALIERAVQPLSEQITSLTKERDEFKQKAEKLEADNKERDDKTRTDKLEAARKRVDAMFNQAIEAKVILPAQREEYVAAFSLNDEDKLVAMTEDDLKRVAAIVNPDGKKEDKKDEAQTRYFSKPSDVDDKGGSTVELTDKTSDGNLVHLTNKYLAEHPTFLPEDPERYTKALEFIMAENPELAKVYVMGNG